MTKRVMVLASVAVMLCVAACDDAGSEDAAQAGQGGSGAGGASGASGGAGGTGGASGTMAGGSGGSDATTSVMCGTSTCTSPIQEMFRDLPQSLRDMLPKACCVDEAMGTCGMSVGTGACTPPLPVEPRCPALGAGVAMVSPCCTEAGMCGLDGSLSGLGCIDLGDPRIAMAMVSAPAPRRCDGMLIEEDSDGGVEAP